MTMNTGTRDLQNALGWAIALGILLIVVGILAMGALLSLLCFLAISSPLVAMRTMMVVLSWAFLIGGIFRLIYASQTRRAKGFWLKLILGILYIALGILLLSDIIGSIFPLTLALGIAIFIEGVFEVFLALRLRPKSSWSWMLLKGMIAIVVGILIGHEQPFSAPGLLVLLPGISFVSTGMWTVIVSLSLLSGEQRLRDCLANYQNILGAENPRF